MSVLREPGELERFTLSIAFVTRLYANYRATKVSEVISEHDDMYNSNMSNPMGHYMAVGVSAVHAICRALITVGKCSVGNVLDVPCGGGRVTRHLSALFPDATIGVADLNKMKESFVVGEFSATPVPTTADFSIPSEHYFDLIYVGSLVTHMNDDQFARTIRWMCAALGPDGVALITTHGRVADHFQRNHFRYIEVDKWQRLYNSYREVGFGYEPYTDPTGVHGPLPYGVSMSAPSWVLRIIESDPEVRIVGFHERALAGHQDVLVVQKKPIAQRSAFWGL